MTTEDYKKKAEQLEKQVAMLKRIIAELTALDKEPLPFTSGNWGD